MDTERESPSHLSEITCCFIVRYMILTVIVINYSLAVECVQ